ncbi:MAG: Fe-S cluster assembly protein SufD [Acidobacteria bacterium]|nr:Fe-S cluster assembly protein SufD [Acidobacteriota bacterium]
MPQVADRVGAFAAEFEAFRRAPAFGPEWLQRRRERAFDRFLERGMPTTRDEEWRFTNVAPIAAESFVRAPEPALTRADLAPHLFEGAGAEIVVVNGRVIRSLCSLQALEPAVSVRTLADGGEIVEDTGALARGDHGHVTAEPSSNAFVDLNDALFEDAIALRVAPGAVVGRPIHVIAVSAGGARPAYVLPRILIHVGEAAEVSIVETYAGIGQGTTLTSAVTQVHLDAGAIVRHVRLQREGDEAFHLGNLAVWLDRASTFTSQALTFGGRIARNDISAVLGGEGAECTLNGLYLATGDSLVDTHTTIDHAKPHCPSHEVYKGILGGRARAVFNGKILVRPDAQKTDAKQTNRALLLTDEAQINTKPQLEIFADDVKCTHGAAIGQLDEDAMFYLRARGVSEPAARVMLIHAFAGEVLDGIAVPAVRELAMHLVDRKLSIEEP